MRNLFIAFAFFVLPSCGFVRDMQANVETVTEVLGQVQTVVAEIQDAKAAADTDGDGKTSTSEWLAYGMTLLGLGGAGAVEARRRVGVRNAESDARKSAAEARLDALEAKQG